MWEYLSCLVRARDNVFDENWGMWSVFFFLLFFSSFSFVSLSPSPSLSMGEGGNMEEGDKRKRN